MQTICKYNKNAVENRRREPLKTDEMKKIWKYLSMFFYCGFTALLLGYFVGGTEGIIAGCVLMAILIVMMRYDGVKSGDISSSLLINLVMIASNFILLEMPELWPFTVTLGVGAVFDIIHKIANKLYDTSSLSAFLKSEMRIAPELELAIAAACVFSMYLEDVLGNPYAWIIPAVLLIDIFRQISGGYFKRKKI